MGTTRLVGRDVSKWALASHQRSARSWGVGVKDFRRLQVWHKAHQLEVYRETSSFPADERFGLTSQLRRAAVSIPANIAEGRGRRTDDDFARFMDYAMGSASEVECHLLLACDLDILPNDSYEHDGGEANASLVPQQVAC